MNPEHKRREGREETVVAQREGLAAPATPQPVDVTADATLTPANGPGPEGTLRRLVETTDPAPVLPTLTDKGEDADVEEALPSTLPGAPYFVEPPPGNLPGIGDLIADRYRLLGLLGEGTYGKVFRASRSDLPAHEVAIKVIDLRVHERRSVTRELLMLAAASHPSIVQLIDHGTDRVKNYAWLVMPFYKDGETLATRLERGELGLCEAYEIFVPIAEAVAALHASGLRHQDIKPDNIYLAKFGGVAYPILLDLGVATGKKSGFVAGTLSYAAPEQLAVFCGKKGGNLSEKVDTYGLGVTLLRALVGEGYSAGREITVSTTSLRELGERANAVQWRATEPLLKQDLPGLQGEPRAKLSHALAKWMALKPRDRSTMAVMAKELSVLLMQDHAERDAVKRKAHRSRVALQVFCVASLVIVTLGILARKTLALAAEVGEFEASEAAGFESVSQCTVAYALLKNTHDGSVATSASALDGCRLDGVNEQNLAATKLAGINQQLSGCRWLNTTKETALNQCRDSLHDEGKRADDLQASVDDMSKALIEFRDRVKQLEGDLALCHGRETKCQADLDGKSVALGEKDGEIVILGNMLAAEVALRKEKAALAVAEGDRANVSALALTGKQKELNLCIAKQPPVVIPAAGGGQPPLVAPAQSPPQGAGGSR